jgi:hypothetical protein
MEGRRACENQMRQNVALGPEFPRTGERKINDGTFDNEKYYITRG